MLEDNISLLEFARKVQPYLKFAPFHERYYRVLEAFALGRIKRLIITMPPQHGKSVGASVLLPAYMLGLNADLKIAIASYNATLASRFNRRVQRVIDSKEYRELFPSTTIKSSGTSRSGYVRTSDQVEIIGASGELISVGRGGALTGNQVDVFILDDLYKNAMEANSPVVRDNCWEWYTSVVETRIHNGSSELIVFTRWHEEDLIGQLESKEKVVELATWEQLADHDADTWLRLNFEALKESRPTELDPRRKGAALWEERHGRQLLLKKRRLDPRGFDALYQGKPSSKEGLLYGDMLRTYRSLPHDIVRRGNYTDTADMGEDFLCSICYEAGADGTIYITDVVYSQEHMEITEKRVIEMLRRNATTEVTVESNNGGRGFARVLAAGVPTARVEWFHQGANKEARILSNSTTVVRSVVMPCDWQVRWSDFGHHLATYRRLFRSNRWHDAADALTGIVEKEVLGSLTKKIMAVGFR
ncbi:terminase [Bacteroidia bacterium]|nr:terminase [Bacteroidia bacterium]